MRQKLCLIFFIVLFTPHSSLLVFPQGDPFNWTEPVKIESNDIFLQWIEDDAGTPKCYQKVYRFKLDSTWLPTDSLISKTTRQEDNRQDAYMYTDAATGRFNYDSYDDVVSIWQGATAINIMLPKFDTTQALWTTSIRDSINSPLGSEVFEDRIYVRTTDIDGDSLDEFLVSYLDNEDSIHFNLYDVDTTLQSTLISSLCDETVDYNGSGLEVKYCIATGDFNGDGTDELILIALANSFQVKVRVYDFQNGIIVPMVESLSTLCFNLVNGTVVFSMALSQGNFISDTKEEIVFAASSDDSPLTETCFWLLEVSSDLQSINIGNGLTLNSRNDLYSLSSGDLNNDGRDEVVSLIGGYLDVLETDDNLNLTLRTSRSILKNDSFYDFIQSYNCIKVWDVNQDKRKDVIVVKNYHSSSQIDGFFVEMIAVSNDLTQTAVIARLVGDEPQYDTYQPYAIAAGNFDGFDFTIGQPLHYTKNNVTQPMVILNAPPIHFDVLNGQTFDLNECYNGGDCDFFSKYLKINTSSVEVSTKVHKDWLTSYGYSLSGQAVLTPLGVGASINYEAYLLFNYGEHFSSDTTNITTVSVGVEVLAKEDDQIYATVTDYDLWEYPLYYGNEEFPRAAIMTLVPNNVRGQWFPSKSYYALSYIPDHEVGNILSYFPYDTLTNNPNVAQTIRANYVSDSFTLSANTSYDWYLMFSDFTSSQADTSREAGVDYGANFGWVYKGSYSDKSYSTHKTSVTEEIELNSHLGSVDMSLGDVKYTVTPYSYWATNGALVVDYAVKPELAPPGFPNTWWQDYYEDFSDPTFILPWRLDPEKGFALSEEAKRYQTNDIIFYPKDPLSGDTVIITVKIRNYSLISTPSSVSIKFYMNDPDSGGTPIIGINGTNTINTNGSILSRETSDAEFKWVLPSGLPPFPRIYALIDQENTITEIHENNNKGFNVLGRESVSGVAVENDIVPDEYILYQSYPNPFNPLTTIKYSIPQSEEVTIKVFDILGREIEVLTNEFKTAGTYQVIFDASKFASGVYFYQLRSGDFVETKKMILMK